MRSLKNVQINESIQRKRLIYNESFSDKINKYIIYLVFIALTYFSIIGMYEIKPSANSDFEYIFYISIFIFGSYISYSTFTEKKLKEISFSIRKEEAKRRVLEYGKKRNFRISEIASNLIFLNEPTTSISRLDEEKTTIIFFKNNSILYTVIQNGTRINTPVLLSQHLIRKDLKKILSQEKFDLAPKKSYFDMFFNDPS
jgi:hypothetical protein